MLNSGIQPLGGVRWGTHFCHFFRDAADLADTLVPYFKNGLEGNEYCLWVTAEPFSKEMALAHLRECVPDVERRIESGQLEVYGHEEWYERVSRASRSDVVCSRSGARRSSF